jgi:hypothetical protein
MNTLIHFFNFKNNLIMKKTFWLLAVFGIFTVFSCTKLKDTYDAYVQGTIVNNYDSQPIPYADVYFVKLVGSPGTTTGYEQLDSTKADALGKFRFNYTGTINIQYAVRGKHKMYYYVPSSVAYTNFGKNKTTDSLLVGLFPKSYIKVSIKDTSKISNYKGIRFLTTFLEPDRDIFKFPLDTTLTINTHYENTGITWYLLYEENRWGVFNRIPFKCERPFDTCKIDIKF